MGAPLVYNDDISV